jgi:hypothetical protein
MLKIEIWRYNVIPYCASLFLLWGAHMDLQKIMSSYSSYYLLKYTMKCKPHDAIKVGSTWTFRYTFANDFIIDYFKICVTFENNIYMFANPNCLKKYNNQIYWFKIAFIANQNCKEIKNVWIPLYWHLH